jgi:lysophospholipid acyltransferase (LPLAT)-like uncharacterized protein
MTFKEWIFHTILPPITYFLINLLSSTVRIQTIGESVIQDLIEKKAKVIYVFWHGRHFLMIRYWKRTKTAIMTSTSRDGQLLAKILMKFGYGIIYGSSSKSPVKALVSGIKTMNAGYNVAIAVDGPKGPPNKVKYGALYLAKKSDAFIVPVTTTTLPVFVFNSWDRYIVPKPFSKALISFGEPFKLSNTIDDKTLKLESKYIEKILNSITNKADHLIQKRT